jgi:hypothetical protein
MGGRCWIDVWDVRLTRRAGGLGLPPEERDSLPQFMERDMVRMKITAPSAGHLVVLDDQLNIEMTCLMPSIFAPTTKIRDKSVVLPTAVEDSRTAAFHIARPEGLHRLYAIWSVQPPKLTWIKSLSEHDDPAVLSEEELATFVDGIAVAYSGNPANIAVAATDYRVV